MQGRDVLLVAAPVLGLAANTVSMTLLYRTKPSFGLLRSEYAGFVTGALVAAACCIPSMLSPSGNPANAASRALLSLLAYAGSGYCHYHFVNLGETARRVRIARELHKAGGLTLEQLKARYNAETIVSIRFGRLLKTGQIVERDGRFRIGRKTVLRIARALVALKVLFLGKKSEYE